ncbi:MAG: hypothetical protein M1839_003170 [Geoglossum umbratile]|nr:MAG: hypothetical protein M1839_003170 [Geoglossum umbratile]
MFLVKEHIVPCQHIREYPQATAHKQEDILHLAVKQYIPLDNQSPSPGDVTIIAAHANGFPKEIFEPVWEEILRHSKAHDLRIRSIWIADVAQQGASGVLNEKLLGDDPSCNDHARDLLNMVNHFRTEMPRPIVGIGHSMGGTRLIQLSIMHPRLLTALALLDPVMLEPDSDLDLPANMQAITFRRDLWQSREDAESYFLKNILYRDMDKRVLQRWLKYGVRNVPTEIYELSSSVPKTAVTLTTTKHQEAFTFVRPNYHGRSPDGKAVINRDTHADVYPEAKHVAPFYRPEPMQAFLNLPHIRPGVLYVFGELSYISSPENQDRRMEATGTGVGGSGGVKEGRVKKVVLKGIGHLVVMEAVDQTADAISTWLGMELQRWRQKEDQFRSMWSAKTDLEKITTSKEWRESMRPSRKANL